MARGHTDDEKIIPGSHNGTLSKCLDKYISQCDNVNTNIVLRYIYDTDRFSAGQRGNTMNTHIQKVYVPMTETGFYILLCLRKEAHGYSIVKQVEELTQGEIRISPGTMYGSLSKMEKDGLIRFVREEEKKKIYCITELGTQVLELELKRIKRLYRTVKEVCDSEKH